MSPDSDAQEGAGKTEGLQAAWSLRGSITFEQWVIDVAQAYYDARIGLEAASRMLGESVAEVQAVLRLATLPDDTLALLSGLEPPNTTWFLLSTCNRDELQAALAALAGMAPEASPFFTVREAIEAARGPDVIERVRELSADVLWRMASKAKNYNVLSPHERGVLGKWGMTRKKGKLTPAQAAWLKQMLEKLVDAKAVKRDTQDDDQEACDAVLDALGEP